MAKRITPDLLTERGACGNQIKLFAELFPDGTEVTEELCIRYAEEFDFYWATEYLLPKEVWQEYLRTRGETLAEYRRIGDKAWAEYCRIRDEEGAECLRTRGEAWAEYCRIAKKAQTECDRVCAADFARLWLEYMSD